MLSITFSEALSSLPLSCVLSSPSLLSFSFTFPAAVELTLCNLHQWNLLASSDMQRHSHLFRCRVQVDLYSLFKTKFAGTVGAGWMPYDDSSRLPLLTLAGVADATDCNYLWCWRRQRQQHGGTLRNSFEREFFREVSEVPYVLSFVLFARTARGRNCY